MLAYTDIYFDVAAARPARFDLLRFDTDKVLFDCENVFAATRSSDDKERAEKKLFEFMLENNAQDALHIRNRSTSLPINDEVLDIYVSVYDDFEGIFDNKDKYTVKEE